MTLTEETRVGDPVVIVATGRSGTAVRWHNSATDAAFPAQARLTATARGVMVVGYLTDLPAGWVDAAVRAHRRLRDRPAEDMSGLATHVHRGPPNGPIVPKGG